MSQAYVCACGITMATLAHGCGTVGTSITIPICPAPTSAPFHHHRSNRHDGHFFDGHRDWAFALYGYEDQVMSEDDLALWDAIVSAVSPVAVRAYIEKHDNLRPTGLGWRITNLANEIVAARIKNKGEQST